MNCLRIGATARIAFCTVISAALVTPATAGLVDPGTYRLHNHPDGTGAPPGYGLRLDELFDVTTGHDVFTFDFDAPGAAMWLDYDGSTIHIYGTAFGGHDVGSTYGAQSSWVEIDFTYMFGVQSVPGDNDVWVVGDDFANTGTLTWLETGEEIDLYDYSGSFGYAFRLGNEDDDDGHRGFPGISGWGWLNHHEPGPDNHIAHSDWLFTAQLIPLPPAAVLGATGLIGLLGLRRRRGRQTI